MGKPRETASKLVCLTERRIPVCLGVVVSRYKRANNDYKNL